VTRRHETLELAGLGSGTPPPEATALAEEVRARLASAGDPERAPAMQAYMRSAMPFRGVSAPMVRAVCRERFQTHPMPDARAWQAAVLLLWDEAAYREERYAAILLAGHRRYRPHQAPETLRLYRHLVETGAWWDTVDVIAATHVGAVLRAHPIEVTPTMRAWADDPHLWVRRTAVLCQLGSKEVADVDLLRHVLEANLEGSRRGGEFFIRKAVGWALRQHARVDPEWVRRFVAEHADRLSGLSRREALRRLG
jgi:3-methyladenine DNA glycosylase AlkD